MESKTMNAAHFSRENGLDQYAFRRWLRAQGTRVGRGKIHRLPAELDSPEAQATVSAFKESKWYVAPEGNEDQLQLEV